MSLRHSIVKYRNKLTGTSAIHLRLNEVDVHEKDIRGQVRELRDRMQLLQSTLDALCSRPEFKTVSLNSKMLLARLYTGILIYLNPDDISVTPHIAVDSLWEHEITKAWLSVIKEDYVTFDIGANFGYFGLLARQYSRNKKSKVVMFEANKHLVPYMKKSLAANNMEDRTVIEALAISDKNGYVYLNILKDYMGSSSVKTMDELDSYVSGKIELEIDESLKVESITLDEYCQKKGIESVNLIKMDIERNEEKAYAGMRGIVKKSEDITMFVEFTKDGYENPKKFYDTMLKDFGNVYTIAKDGKLVKPSNTSYEKIIDWSDDWVMPVFSKNPNLHKSKTRIL